MIREVVGHSGPARKRRKSSPPSQRPTTIGGTYIHSDANTEIKSRVSCFSLLLNFNSNESTHIN